MSDDKSSKVFLWLVVVLVIVLLGAWYLWQGNVSQSMYAPSANSSPATGVAYNTSDVSLNQDMASIDSSMTAVDNNSASVDSSLNDQPVSQTE